MWKLLLSLSLFIPTLSQAAIFDSADILPKNSGAGGVFGEILLSDPTSEGVELQGRYGLSDDWNVKGIIGFGSKTKRFRVGGEGIFNIIPDYEGQLGFSALGSVTYINRGDFLGGGMQLRIAPMIHKTISTWADLPANLYAALPLYFEGRRGTYTTGSQFVVGSLFDLNSTARSYISTEVGIRLSKAESYLLLGFGLRIGELKFTKRGRPANVDSEPRAKGANGKDFTDADFR
ncbi:MAG: hypothetical protein EOP11_22565 [Proteobacteria bacterium]|nr:MAG: hypothetical protein EOP11_22565 [Pseudomonadota bacterium]